MEQSAVNKLCHKAVIQKNFTFLKEDLDVKGCVDYMFEADILNQEELEDCMANKKKFLKILMRKGPKGYRAFIGALERTRQFHVKQRLDETCESTGRIDLLYVNREEIERIHQARLAELERRISELEQDNTEKANDIIHISLENQEAIRNLKSDHEKAISDLEQRRIQKVNQLDLELQNVLTKNSDIQSHLQDTEERRTKLEKECFALEKAFQELSDKYEALVPSQRKPISSKREKYSMQADTGDTCGLCHKTFYEDETVFLLPCLHRTCVECKDNDQDLSEGQCSICLTPFQFEDLKPDPARRCHQFIQSLKSSTSCGYSISHDNEPPVSYCQQCERTLCAKCKTIHNQTTVHLQHQTYDFEDLHQLSPQELMKKVFCLVHPEATLALYDTTCGENICVVCAQEEHRDHSLTSIDKAYNSAKENFEEPLQDLQNKSKEIQRGIQEAEDLEDDIDAMAATLNDNVAKTREFLLDLVLKREKQLRDDVINCSELSKFAVAEIRNRLCQMNDSVETTVGFIKKMRDFCSKTDFMDLKNLAEEKAQRDLRVQPPRVDRRCLQMKVSMVGFRALIEQINTMMSLYSVPEGASDDFMPDDVPTVPEFKGEIQKLEQTIRTLNEDLDRTTREKEREESRLVILNRDYKAQIYTQNEEHLRTKQKHISHIKVLQQSLQTEKEQNLHLKKRCHGLERGMLDKTEKIKQLGKDFEETRQEASEENRLIHSKYKQLEQSFEQKIVCVGRHRSEHENCMIECSKIAFAVERLDEKVGSIIDGVFTNRPSESQNNPRRKVFKKYNGTVSCTPIYPAPCRSHQYPAYWEAAVDVELLRELLHSETILEIGVVSESLLDKYTLVYREKHAWCLVLRFCRSHKSICLQIWKDGMFVTCSSDAMPNRSGESNAFKFGGFFDAENGKLAFLDLAKGTKLASFEIEHDHPLFLTFGFPPKCEHFTIHFRLIPPANLSMNAEKKSLIYSAFR